MSRSQRTNGWNHLFPPSICVEYRNFDLQRLIEDKDINCARNYDCWSWPRQKSMLSFSSYTISYMIWLFAFRMSLQHFKISSCFLVFKPQISNSTICSSHMYDTYNIKWLRLLVWMLCWMIDLILMLGSKGYLGKAIHRRTVRVSTYYHNVESIDLTLIVLCLLGWDWFVCSIPNTANTSSN